MIHEENNELKEIFQYEFVKKYVFRINNNKHLYKAFLSILNQLLFVCQSDVACPISSDYFINF